MTAALKFMSLFPGSKLGCFSTTENSGQAESIVFCDLSLISDPFYLCYSFARG
jgi:hypothetical protein